MKLLSITIINTIKLKNRNLFAVADVEESEADVVGAGELVFTAPGGAVALIGAVFAVGLTVAHPRRRYAAVLPGPAAHLLSPAHRVAAVAVPAGAHRFSVAILFVDARLAVLFPVTSNSNTLTFSTFS